MPSAAANAGGLIPVVGERLAAFRAGADHRHHRDETDDPDAERGEAPPPDIRRRHREATEPIPRQRRLGGHASIQLPERSAGTSTSTSMAKR